MSRPIQKRIVVDASVLRAAGTSEHPVSTACREALEEILKICHRSVVSPEIEKEYRKHASTFAFTWLAAMQSRRKALPPEGPCPSELDGAIASIEDPADHKAARKDRLLVAAALQADGMVLSLDDKAGRIFCDLGRAGGSLHRLRWVNPTANPASVIRWLRAGATGMPGPTPKHRGAR